MSLIDRPAPVPPRPISAASPTGCDTVVDVVCRWLSHELGRRQVHTVAGEAFLPLMAEGPRHDLELVATRHEAGAGFMAIAAAQLDGRPGVVAVNRSPGASNVAIAIDAAAAAETPLLVLIGGIPAGADRRRAFQGTDVAAMFAPRADVKTVTAETLHADLSDTTELLIGTRPGPVVLVIPEDLWLAPAGATVSAGTADPAPETGARGRLPRPTPHLAAEEIGFALGRARRPVVVAGGLLRRGRSDTSHEDDLRDWAAHVRVPVLAGNKAQDILDNDHVLFAGHLHVGTPPPVRERLADADLVVLLGQYPDDVCTRGWSGVATHVVHPSPWGGDHDSPGPAERRYAEDPAAVLRLLREAGNGTGEREGGWLAGWHQLALADRTWSPVSHDDGIDFGAVISELDHQQTGPAVITLDAGNFSSWAHRHLAVGRRRRLIGLPNGAMGFGVPAAVEAAQRCPRHTVIGVVGDGGLLMSGNELATGRARGRCPIVIVADNGSYGTIHEHARRRGLTPLAGTTLTSPDLVTWASSFGVPGERVTMTAEVPAALGRALDAGPDGYLLHVLTSLSAGHAYRPAAGAAS